MDIEKLSASLMEHEGVRTSPYIDTEGHKTIGCGHNMDAKPLSPQIGAWLEIHGSITMDMVRQLLDDDITDCIREVSGALPWYGREDDCRQRALIELAFNLGLTGLLGFKNTLNFWKNHQYEQAANGLLDSKWATQVGNRANVIADMVRTGQDATS